MSAAELRIQLEGKYEVVEAAVSKCESAIRKLHASDWLELRGWLDVAAVAEMPEAAVLERKAREIGCDEGLQLLVRSKRSNERLTFLLHQRLRGLGAAPHGGVQQLGQQLSREFPLEHRERFLDRGKFPIVAGLALLAFGLALKAVATTSPPAANYCVQPQGPDGGLLMIAFVLACLAGAIVMYSALTSVDIVVTQHHLVANGRGWALRDLESVEVARGLGWRSFSLTLTTPSGIWHTPEIVGSPVALLEVLRRKGVVVIGG